MRIPYSGKYLIPGLVLLLVTGCREEIVPEEYLPGNAHEAYQYGLEQAGLNTTALGRDWIDKAQHVLESPVDIELPFEEVFYWDQARAEAEGYRFFVKRGLRVEVELEVQSLTPIRPLSVRVAAWEELTGREIKTVNVTLGQDYDRLLALLREEEPDTIVHFAEQRAAPYSVHACSGPDLETSGALGAGTPLSADLCPS